MDEEKKEYTIDDILEYMRNDEEWDIPERAKKMYLDSLLPRLLYS